MELLWTYGQKRLVREMEDQAAVLQHGVREGMTDVYVALKRLRRRGGRPSPRREGVQAGLTGADLETAVGRWAIQFPDRVN